MKWKKMRKSFKTLFSMEAMAHKTPLKGSSLKIEILTRLLFLFI